MQSFLNVSSDIHTDVAAHPSITFKQITEMFSSVLFCLHIFVSLYFTGQNLILSVSHIKQEHPLLDFVLQYIHADITQMMEL